jgi:hypothetical protein
MSTIQVTAAGNQLYEVEIHDPEGSSTQHTVTLGDGLLDRVAVDDVPMRDVVAAAVEFLSGHEGRQELDREIDLSAAAARYDGFLDEVPARARSLASQPAALQTDDERAAADAPSGDERLLAEVRREQADGDATSGRREL